MRIINFLLVILITTPLYVHAQATDSIKQKKKNPSFIALDVKAGQVIATNEFVQGDNKIPFYNSFSLKYGRNAKGDRWEDYAYGMPYWGIGIYNANFFRKSDLGRPFSLYVFQGATIKQFTPRFSWKYEWNLGMSFNWKAYDPFDNPYNIALGSSVNVHVAVGSYVKWDLGSHWDLHAGLTLTHFSNGAAKLPNKGLNMVAPYVELVYNFDDSKISQIPPVGMTPPKVPKRVDQDISITITGRQTRVDTTGTGLPSRYLNKKFNVFGLSYATMFVNSYKYKWGPSLDIVYDESSGVTAWREENPRDGQLYERVKLDKFFNRLSIGVSMRGETTMDKFGVFANFGYNFLHANEKDTRLYQVIGVKLYLAEDLFGTFGIRANNFSRAQYLYWTLGYTIKGKEGKKLPFF